MTSIFDRNEACFVYAHFQLLKHRFPLLNDLHVYLEEIK